MFIYPNTAIDLYPDLVWTWKIDADDALDHARHGLAATGHPDASLRTRLAQRVNYRVNKVVGDEDFDLVKNVQAGIQTRGWEPGPLSGREAAVAWFADRIRADLGEDA